MEAERILPKVGVGVFVVKGDKFLICERHGAHGEGSWSVPGGHLEFNESPLDCAIREVKEETGLTIHQKDLYELGFTNDIFPKEHKHYVTLYYLAEYIGKKPAKDVEPSRQGQWEWLSWEEVCKKPLFIPMQNLIKKGVRPLDHLKKKK